MLRQDLSLSCLDRLKSKGRDMQIFFLCNRSSHFRVTVLKGKIQKIGKISSCSRKWCRKVNLEFPDSVKIEFQKLVGLGILG